MSVLKTTALTLTGIFAIGSPYFIHDLLPYTWDTVSEDTIPTSPYLTQKQEISIRQMPN